MQPLTASQMEALEEAVKSYQAALTVDAAQWLVNRGLDRKTVVTSRLGVAAEPAPGHARFKGMLAIPYFDRHGRPVTIRFRCLEQHDHREHYHGKYNSLPDEPSRMFNVGAIFQAEHEFHLTEGELDALILQKIGLPAGAMPGASAFAWRHQKMLAGFSRVWVWGDPDEAGAEFVSKVTKSLRQARGVPLKPSVGDVTETYLAGGEDALLALIREED